MTTKRVRRTFSEAVHSLAEDKASSTPPPSQNTRRRANGSSRSTVHNVDKTKGTLSLSKNNPSHGAEQVVELSVIDRMNNATELRRQEFDLTDPRRYIGFDGYLWIGKADWAALQAKYNSAETRTHLVALLDSIITQFKLEPPTREILRDEAIEAFQELKALPEGALFVSSRVESRYNYRGTLGLLSVDANNAGNLCLDYFFQDLRWACKGGRADSPTESWYDMKSRRAVLHHIIDSNVPFIDRPRLRTHLGTRRFIPTASRPSVAKSLFDLYRPDSVLDLSFGWGERLLGFEASKYGTRYIGIDPDKRTLEAGQAMHRLCRQTRKSVELYCSPAEDFVYDMLEDPVDMVIFAPPPFNNERYTDEETQAYKRYESLDAFIKCFLKKSIMAAWECLVEGGTLVLDLGDLKAPSRDRAGHKTGGRHRIVDPLLRDILNELPESVYRGTIGMGLGHKRINNPHGVLRVDPLWIITKGRCDVARRGLFGSQTVKKLDAKKKAK